MNMDMCFVLIDFTVKLVDFVFEVIFSNNFLSCSPAFKESSLCIATEKVGGSSSEK